MNLMKMELTVSYVLCNFYVFYGLLCFHFPPGDVNADADVSNAISENIAELIEEHESEDVPNRGLNAVGIEEDTVVPYAVRLTNARAKLEGMLGEKVTITNARGGRVEWSVVKECHQENYTPERQDIGLKNFSIKDAEEETIFADICMLLSPLTWQQQLFRLNTAIDKHNTNSSSKGIIHFTGQEFFTARALVFASVCFSENGSQLFECDEEAAFAGWTIPPAFKKHMKLYRFKEYRRFIPITMESEDLKRDGDDWYQAKDYIDRFNKRRMDEVTFSVWDILDESMSAFVPKKTKLGGLPNISYIQRKPEPLGTEFKVGSCSVIKMIKTLEIQEGKDRMKAKKYFTELGATAGCSMRLAESGCGEDSAGGIKGDSWFGSVKVADKLGTMGMMRVLVVSLFLFNFITSITYYDTCYLCLCR